MPGTMKSELELTQMMMADLRKHPECAEVDRVLLLRPVFAVSGAHSRRQERSAHQSAILGCRTRNTT
jgi:hypothetical protein